MKKFHVQAEIRIWAEIQIQAKDFVPSWKHLTTWINQECWEEETDTSAQKATITPQNMTIQKIIEQIISLFRIVT